MPHNIHAQKTKLEAEVGKTTRYVTLIVINESVKKQKNVETNGLH